MDGSSLADLVEEPRDAHVTTKNELGGSIGGRTDPQQRCDHAPTNLHSTECVSTVDPTLSLLARQVGATYAWRRQCPRNQPKY
ncbi:hypothetical protein PCASD_17875 [Puccinia coronata f. sp. avenae]|uniref:Uncharacterized protein n=1 Tax=Puccinia coronata f. sp. avenae TaxID=200324 RepID=A0A2N5U160_9BASI|nr:hypothetical protein PCASD_17875 [Puccinia coronata f. sp. avenae]